MPVEVTEHEAAPEGPQSRLGGVHNDRTEAAQGSRASGEEDEADRDTYSPDRILERDTKLGEQAAGIYRGPAQKDPGTDVLLRKSLPRPAADWSTVSRSAETRAAYAAALQRKRKGD